MAPGGGGARGSINLVAFHTLKGMPDTTPDLLTLSPYGSTAATCPVCRSPYAGHTLRAGFATGRPHKFLNTLRKYIRDRPLFRDNPAAKLGSDLAAQYAQPP